MFTNQDTVGEVLRDWRQRRRLSQLDLACEADVSTRHISFVETGRASPSRDMLIRLAERMALPLRARNHLLLAGGFAPLHGERTLDAAEMADVRAAIDAVLRGHEPFPALAVDRHWTLIAANSALEPLLEGVDPALLTPPVNVLRLSLHPEGLAPRILNLGEWRQHLLERLRCQAEASGDRVLVQMHSELAALPGRAAKAGSSPPNRVAAMLQLRDPATEQVLSFLSTTTVFGTAVDITLAELSLECFFPADAQTRARLTERQS